MALTWLEAARIALQQPKVITHRLRLVLESPYYFRQRIHWLSELTQAPRSEVQKYVREVEHDKDFIRDIRAAFGHHTLYLPLPTDFMMTRSGSSMFFHCVLLHAFVRLVRPRVVVETGGTPGKTSAFILRALQRNERGHLYTIDLPPCEVEEGETIKVNEVHHRKPLGVEPNWCVPAWLRGWQTLLIGPAQEYLRPLLDDLGEIDVFIHDSDHSYGHMRWEFAIAYPYIRGGGFLLADDIRANTAWEDFCAEHKLVSREFGQLGAVRKDKR